MAVASPFGGETRKRILREYFKRLPLPAPEAAWEHVYHLLLSIDRRTRLAHVYDSNHMQPQGNFHSRAVRFTELLCQEWGVSQQQLRSHVDFLFQGCVNEYLSQRTGSVARTVKATAEKAIEIVSDGEEMGEETSGFLVEITDLLVSRLGLQNSPALAQVVAEIEEKAEHYFAIEKKRQNVRGEGFEDTLEWMLLHIARLPGEQIRVRQAANELPGFKGELLSEGKAREKVPKPDIVILSPAGDLTLWIITVKWSLRQDRLDQFGQEAAFYQANRIQGTTIDYVLVTNEMDVARLCDVLAPPAGGGGFHFDRVYHVNRDLLEATQGEKFERLEIFKRTGRLLSLTDLFRHVLTLTAPATPPRRRR